MSLVGEQRISRLTATFPRWGQWSVEAVLESGEPPARGSLVDLDVAGLALVGTVLRSGLDAPERPSVHVVGGLGWSNPVPSPPKLTFYSDAGVRLSRILERLAAGAGEPIEQPVDMTVGLHYVGIGSRPGEPARYRDALVELVRARHVPGWWVGPDGITRFITRAGGEVAGRATALPARGSAGMRRFGIDSAEEFLPGRLVDGVPIERAVVIETPGSLVVECWAA